jgi:hypothetical protein
MSDPYVFHYELLREGAPKPLALIETLCMEPAEYHSFGPRKVKRAVEQRRRQLQGYVLKVEGPGYSVSVRRERGYLRSVWPGAALRPAPAPAGVLSVSGVGGSPP